MASAWRFYGTDFTQNLVEMGRVMIMLPVFSEDREIRRGLPYDIYMDIVTKLLFSEGFGE